jgi:hypothetical protein
MAGEEAENQIYFLTELDEELTGMETTVEFDFLKEKIKDVKSVIKRPQKVPIDSDTVKEELNRLINIFSGLFETQDGNSKHYIDEIQLNVAATAQGSFLVVSGSVTGGITITIKQRE